MDFNKAKKINDALDVNIFNEKIIDRLVLNKFTKKQVHDLCIDDLVIFNGKIYRPTPRLLKLSEEIIKGNLK